MTDTLERYRRAWKAKPLLEDLYGDFYDRIAHACVEGRTVEIGGGIGNLKARLPDVLATDIQFAPWLDCVADAQKLPFKDCTIGNLVMVDVLHHIEFPLVFFEEAARVLRPGGRVVMVEPAITLGSTLFYRFLHQEPVRMRADPLETGVPDAGRDPYTSNQAIPTLIATRHRRRFDEIAAPLRVQSAEHFALAAYPLSGGFKSWSLIPRGAATTLMRIESYVEPILGRWLAFRMLLVIEKAG